jgi:hypothetical protein
MKTVLRGNQMLCTVCGQHEMIHFPIPIQEFVKKIDAFNLKHKNCKR